MKLNHVNLTVFDALETRLFVGRINERLKADGFDVRLSLI